MIGIGMTKYITQHVAFFLQRVLHYVVLCVSMAIAKTKKMVTCTPVRGRKRKIVVTSAYSFTFERRLLLLPFVERCFVAFLVSV